MDLKWQGIPDDELSSDDVNELLYAVQNDLWVVSACVDRVVNNFEVQRDLINLGLRRAATWAKRIQIALETLAKSGGYSSLSECSEAYFLANPEDHRMILMRQLLLRRRGHLLTYQEILHAAHSKHGGGGTEDSEVEEDPWGLESESLEPSPSTRLLPLSPFLVGDIFHCAMELACTQEFSALGVVWRRHWSTLAAHRYTILESISEDVEPRDFQSLLPHVDPQTNHELFPDSAPWSGEDWFERLHKQEQVETQPLSGNAVALWYIKRAYQIEVSGLPQHALRLLRLGSSFHVPDLDGTIRDFDFYVQFLHSSQGTDLLKGEHQISIHAFRSLKANIVTAHYITHSTPENVARVIQGTVTPYLLSKELHERLGEGQIPPLFDAILHAPLKFVAPICEVSKPVRPLNQRIIQNDTDLVTIALSCLYGCDAVDQWQSMSAIFECLPVWDGCPSVAQDTRERTLGTLAVFSSCKDCVPASEFYTLFTSMPMETLSLIVDALDLHLEAGELFEKWGVPSPLRSMPGIWNDVDNQRSWCTKISRHVCSSNQVVDPVAHWADLFDDLLGLRRGNSSTRGVFGLLAEEDIKKILYNALLSSKQFDVVSALISSPHQRLEIRLETLQSLCLSASREFFDNADSGNFHYGDMKAAYDCLSVAPDSIETLREREFIEATSRISSFRLRSNSGNEITPLELRLTKDRIDLVTRILSQTPNAYQHLEPILDIANKLGFRGDPTVPIRVHVLAAHSAMHDEHFDTAAKYCITAVRLLEPCCLTAVQAGHGIPSGHISLVSLVDDCWQLSFQLGRQSEYTDTRQKLILLGYSLRLCPPDQILSILPAWRELSNVRLLELQEGKRSVPDRQQWVGTIVSTVARDLASSKAPFNNAANIASKTLNRVAAGLPFSTNQPNTADVSSQARHALSRGIGWLIGGDEAD